MRKFTVLIIAILLGLFLRVLNLGSIPQGFTWDEAALGYNAYSILQTGRDEFGKFLPLIFKSFGDYKPGLYIYTAVPSIAIFGLNEFATRLPSAIAGVLAIIGVYLLVKKISQNHLLASFSALALSVSAWHIHFSRGAWEVNLYTTLLLYAILFFIKFLKGESSLLPSLVLASSTLVTYQVAKMLTPLVFLVVALAYFKDFKEKTLEYLKTKNSIIYLLPILIFGLWVYSGTFFGVSGNRLARLSIFSYKPPTPEITKEIDDYNPLTLNIFHSTSQNTARLIASRYLYYFSPEVLFYQGKTTSDRGHIPRSGMFNPFEFLIIIFGLVYLSSKRETWSRLILVLLLIAPIPASLTLSEFSTVRSLFMTIPWAIISGSGIYFLYLKSKPLLTVIALVYFFGFAYINDLYFNHGQYVFPKEFLYGYKQAFEFAKENPQSRVVATDVFGQPYIFYLFYTKYDPREYQKTNHFIDMGIDVGRVDKVGLAEFHQFGFGDILTYKDTIFIGTEGNIRNDADLTHPVVDFYRSIKYPDGEEVYRVLKTKAL